MNAKSTYILIAISFVVAPAQAAGAEAPSHPAVAVLQKHVQSRNGDRVVSIPTKFNLTGASINSNFSQVGYYGQAGLMPPPELESATCAGHFQRDESSNRIVVHAVGLSSCIYGVNIQIERDRTCFANEVPISSLTIGSAVNTPKSFLNCTLNRSFA